MSGGACRVGFVLLVCIFGRSVVDGMCYIENANAECPVCWKTTYSSEEDKFGVTVAQPCPEGIVERWEIPLPDEMVEHVEYPVEFSIKVDNRLFPVRAKDDSFHIPHANIHSCISSRGACTPFVGNSPGLATHTPAMVSSLDADGRASFDTVVQLPQEYYTIIAHVRFWVHHGDEANNTLTKYDVAIGVSRNVKPEASLCDPGSLYNRDSGSCTPCPAGTSQVKSECVPCPPGTHSPLEGLAACLPCTRGYANSSGSIECKECPANKQRVPGTPGSSIEECLCKYAFYNRFGPGDPCEPCPAGAVCEGEHARPYPKPGYWADAECAQNVDCPGRDAFFSCVPARKCLGGPDFKCREGFSGRLCEEVEEGYFQVGDRWRFECGKRGWLVNVLGIIGVVFMWIWIKKVAASNYYAMRIALLYVQVTGMVSACGMRWHWAVDHVNTALSLFNFDIDFISPHCVNSKWTFVHRFYIQLLLPIFYVVLYALWKWAGMLWKGGHYKRSVWEVIGDQASRADIIKGGLTFFILTYHTLCIRCFQAFRCRQYPDGHEYMTFAPEVLCWQPQHLWTVVVAGLYIPVVLIGLPAFMFYVVYAGQRDGTLHEPAMMARYGFFYCRYTTEYKWWESVITVRRAVIALIFACLEPPMLQAAAAVLVLLVLLMIHTHCGPFIMHRIDHLEIFTLCNSILYALAGMLFYPSITEAAQGVLCVDDERNPACEAESRLKLVVAVVLLVAFALTVLVAFSVAGVNITETNRQQSARKTIKEILRMDRRGSLASHAVKSQGRRGGVESTDAQSLTESDNALTPSANGQQRTQRSESVQSLMGALQAFHSMGSLQTLVVSANKLQLQDLLSGRLLVAWAQAVRRSSVERHHAAISEWKVAEGVITRLPYDVTHFSKSTMAATLRVLAKLPQLEDYLRDCSEEARKHLLHAIEGYVRFIEDASLRQPRAPSTFAARTSSSAIQPTNPSRYHHAGLVLPEHRPVLLLALLTSSCSEHDSFSALLDDIVSPAALEPHRRPQSSGSAPRSLPKSEPDPGNLSPPLLSSHAAAKDDEPRRGVDGGEPRAGDGGRFRLEGADTLRLKAPDSPSGPRSPLVALRASAALSTPRASLKAGERRLSLPVQVSSAAVQVSAALTGATLYDEPAGSGPLQRDEDRGR